MQKSRTLYTRYERVTAALIALIFSSCLLASASMPEAYADVRRSDLVMDISVDSRGLSVSQCPSIEAESAILVGKDGTVYFSRNADDEKKIASVTKIMTAVIALENASSDTKIEVSTEAAYIGESSAGLQAGDTLSLSDAILALMVPSGNDAAQALAECIGAQLSGQPADSDAAYNAFIDAMNEKAAELGMTNTYYANPHGLDDDGYEGDHHSTAADLAKLVAYAMNIDQFRQAVCNEEATIKVQRDGETVDITLESTDFFLQDYDGAIGVKTGHTDAAGPCFAAAVNRDGQEYYAVVLNSSDDYQRFYDCENLFDWVFEHRISYKVLSGNSTAQVNGSTIPIVGYAAHSDYTDKTIPVTLSDPNLALDVFDLNGNVSQLVTFNDIHGDVTAGTVVGKVSYVQRNITIATVDLVAAEDCPAPGFFEGIQIAISRAFSFFTGQQTVAQSVVTNTMTLINNKSSAQ